MDHSWFNIPDTVEQLPLEKWSEERVKQVYDEFLDIMGDFIEEDDKKTLNNKLKPGKLKGRILKLIFNQVGSNIDILSTIGLFYSHVQEYFRHPMQNAVSPHIKKVIQEVVESQWVDRHFVSSPANIMHDQKEHDQSSQLHVSLDDGNRLPLLFNGSETPTTPVTTIVHTSNTYNENPSLKPPHLKKTDLMDEYDYDVVILSSSPLVQAKSDLYDAYDDNIFWHLGNEALRADLLQHTKDIHIDVLTRASLHAVCGSKTTRILVINCHGWVDERGETFLMAESSDEASRGLCDLIPVKDLEKQITRQARNIGCVILGSCFSAAVVRTFRQFGGVRCVAGVLADTPIETDCCAKFISAFCSGLLCGLKLENAFQYASTSPQLLKNHRKHVTCSSHKHRWWCKPNKDKDRELKGSCMKDCMQNVGHHALGCSYLECAMNSARKQLPADMKMTHLDDPTYFNGTCILLYCSLNDQEVKATEDIKDLFQSWLASHDVINDYARELQQLVPLDAKMYPFPYPVPHGCKAPACFIAQFSSQEVAQGLLEAYDNLCVMGKVSPLNYVGAFPQRFHVAVLTWCCCSILVPHKERNKFIIDAAEDAYGKPYFHDRLGKTTREVKLNMGSQFTFVRCFGRNMELYRVLQFLRQKRILIVHGVRGSGRKTFVSMLKPYYAQYGAEVQVVNFREKHRFDQPDENKQQDESKEAYAVKALYTSLHDLFFKETQSNHNMDFTFEGLTSMLMSLKHKRLFMILNDVHHLGATIRDLLLSIIHANEATTTSPYITVVCTSVDALQMDIELSDKIAEFKLEGFTDLKYTQKLLHHHLSLAMEAYRNTVTPIQCGKIYNLILSKQLRLPHVIIQMVDDALTYMSQGKDDWAELLVSNADTSEQLHMELLKNVLLHKPKALELLQMICSFGDGGLLDKMLKFVWCGDEDHEGDTESVTVLMKYLLDVGGKSGRQARMRVFLVEKVYNANTTLWLVNNVVRECLPTFLESNAPHLAASNALTEKWRSRALHKFVQLSRFLAEATMYVNKGQFSDLDHDKAEALYALKSSASVSPIRLFLQKPFCSGRDRVVSETTCLCTMLPSVTGYLQYPPMSKFGIVTVNMARFYAQSWHGNTVLEPLSIHEILLNPVCQNLLDYMPNREVSIVGSDMVAFLLVHRILVTFFLQNYTSPNLLKEDAQNLMKMLMMNYQVYVTKLPEGTKLRSFEQHHINYLHAKMRAEYSWFEAAYGHEMKQHYVPRKQAIESGIKDLCNLLNNYVAPNNDHHDEVELHLLLGDMRILMGKQLRCENLIPVTPEPCDTVDDVQQLADERDHIKEQLTVGRLAQKVLKDAMRLIQEAKDNNVPVTDTKASSMLERDPLELQRLDQKHRCESAMAEVMHQVGRLELSLFNRMVDAKAVLESATSAVREARMYNLRAIDGFGKKDELNAQINKLDAEIQKTKLKQEVFTTQLIVGLYALPLMRSIVDKYAQHKPRVLFPFYDHFQHQRRRNIFDTWQSTRVALSRQRPKNDPEKGINLVLSPLSRKSLTERLENGCKVLQLFTMAPVSTGSEHDVPLLLESTSEVGVCEWMSDLTETIKGSWKKGATMLIVEVQLVEFYDTLTTDEDNDVKTEMQSTVEKRYDTSYMPSWSVLYTDHDKARRFTPAEQKQHSDVIGTMHRTPTKINYATMAQHIQATVFKAFQNSDYIKPALVLVFRPPRAPLPHVFSDSETVHLQTLQFQRLLFAEIFDGAAPKAAFDTAYHEAKIDQDDGNVHAFFCCDGDDVSVQRAEKQPLFTVEKSERQPWSTFECEAGKLVRFDRMLFEPKLAPPYFLPQQHGIQLEHNAALHELLLGLQKKQGVSLHGYDGLGKTSLAVDLGYYALHRNVYPDGVYFLRLTASNSLFALTHSRPTPSREDIHKTMVKAWTDAIKGTHHESETMANPGSLNGVLNHFKEKKALFIFVVDRVNDAVSEVSNADETAEQDESAAEKHARQERRMQQKTGETSLLDHMDDCLCIKRRMQKDKNLFQDHIPGTKRAPIQHLKASASGERLVEWLLQNEVDDAKLTLEERREEAITICQDLMDKHGLAHRGTCGKFEQSNDAWYQFAAKPNFADLQHVLRDLIADTKSSWLLVTQTVVKILDKKVHAPQSPRSNERSRSNSIKQKTPSPFLASHNRGANAWVTPLPTFRLDDHTDDLGSEERLKRQLSSPNPAFIRQPSVVEPTAINESVVVPQPSSISSATMLLSLIQDSRARNKLVSIVHKHVEAFLQHEIVDEKERPRRKFWSLPFNAKKINGWPAKIWQCGSVMTDPMERKDEIPLQRQHISMNDIFLSRSNSARALHASNSAINVSNSSSESDFQSFIYHTVETESDSSPDWDGELSLVQARKLRSIFGEYDELYTGTISRENLNMLLREMNEEERGGKFFGLTPIATLQEVLDYFGWLAGLLDKDPNIVDCLTEEQDVKCAEYLSAIKEELSDGHLTLAQVKAGFVSLLPPNSSDSCAGLETGQTLFTPSQFMAELCAQFKKQSFLSRLHNAKKWLTEAEIGKFDKAFHEHAHKKTKTIEISNEQLYPLMESLLPSRKAAADYVSRLTSQFEDHNDVPCMDFAEFLHTLGQEAGDTIDPKESHIVRQKPKRRKKKHLTNSQLRGVKQSEFEKKQRALGGDGKRSSQKKKQRHANKAGGSHKSTPKGKTQPKPLILSRNNSKDNIHSQKMRFVSRQSSGSSSRNNSNASSRVNSRKSSMDNLTDMIKLPREMRKSPPIRDKNKSSLKQKQRNELVLLSPVIEPQPNKAALLPPLDIAAAIEADKTNN